MFFSFLSNASFVIIWRLHEDEVWLNDRVQNELHLQVGADNQRFVVQVYS